MNNETDLKARAMKKILITGGSGTIGKACIPFFLGAGYEVDNFDKLKGDDIFDQDLLSERMRGCDAVLHLAAIPHPCLSGVSDDDYWRVNLEGTKNVFRACESSGVKRLVYLSTGCVYGFWGGYCRPDKFPISEDNYKPSLSEGLTVYGATKLAAEEFLQTVSSSDGVTTVALRTEGPGAGGTRLEWINGHQNLEYRATSATSPAYHFFARISKENLFQALELSVNVNLKSAYDVFNIGNEYIHWSIDVQKWLRLHWPNVPNETKGNEALFGINKAKKILGYQPYPVDDHFLNRDAIENYYYSEAYFGKLGKP